MRKLLFGLFGFLLAVPLLSSAGFAQGASCPISKQIPEVVSGTTYTLIPADGCKLKVFTNGSAVTLSAANPATTFPAGYQVTIKAQGTGTVTFTPTTATLDGLSSAIAWTTGTGGTLWTDGTNWYSCCLGIKKP